MFSLAVDKDIKLELLELQHAQDLFALVDANRAHLEPWMPWVEATTSVSVIEAFIKRSLERFGQRNGFELGIVYEQSLVGIVGLHAIDWSVGQTELGYWLSKDHESSGIISRAVSSLIKQLFEHYKLNRIEIRADPKNTRSRAVAKRLGFLEEGILRQVVSYKKERRDQVLYSLLKEEWSNQSVTKHE